MDRSEIRDGLITRHQLFSDIQEPPVTCPAAKQIASLSVVGASATDRDPEVHLRLSRCRPAVSVTAVSCAPAAVAGSNPVLRQCGSGSRAAEYSMGQLRRAMALLTAAEKQYTRCQGVIQQALEAAVAKRRTKSVLGSGSSGSSLPDPAIVILVLLGLVGVTCAAVAVRRRRGDDDP